MWFVPCRIDWEFLIEPWRIVLEPGVVFEFGVVFALGFDFTNYQLLTTNYCFLVLFLNLTLLTTNY